MHICSYLCIHHTFTSCGHILYQTSIFLWWGSCSIPWRPPSGPNQHKEKGDFSKIRDVSLLPQKKIGGGGGTGKHQKKKNLPKLHRKGKVVSPPPPKSRHKKYPPGCLGGSWGCGTCKSCSKGFSAKRSSSSSSWKCGCKDKNDAMLVIMMRYDEVWWDNDIWLNIFVLRFKHDVIYHDFSWSSEKYGRCTVGLWRQAMNWSNNHLRIRPRAQHDIKKLQYNTPQQLQEPPHKTNAFLIQHHPKSTKASPWFTYPVPPGSPWLTFENPLCLRRIFAPVILGTLADQNIAGKKRVETLPFSWFDSQVPFQQKKDWLASNRSMFNIRKFRSLPKKIGVEDRFFFWELSPPPCAVLTSLGWKNPQLLDMTYPSKILGIAKQTTHKKISSPSSSKWVQKPSQPKKVGIPKKKRNKK